MSKINDPKIVTERLKKDIIKLVIDEVVIEDESVKIFATIPLPNKIHEREMDKTDIPGTFNAGATLGPVNETNMTRIWNKHKQTNTPLKRKVFVAMSGGVDSSVAAALLKQEGYEVIGVFLHGWEPPRLAAANGRRAAMACDWREERRSALRAAARLSIPLLTCEASEEYETLIVKPMIADYRAGRTPNPDVWCNRLIKFDFLWRFAQAHGGGLLATGHYAQKKLLGSSFQLLTSKDKEKDQTYFLWTLTQNDLVHTFFPVGGYRKSQVRALAGRFRLPNADKPDSQGLCFIGPLDFKSFLRAYLPIRLGSVQDERGREIGEHDGVYFYTIGERHGFRAAPEAQTPDFPPLYVIAKNVEKNILVVAAKPLASAGTKGEIVVERVNWISAAPPRSDLALKARIRYRAALADCRAENLGGDRWRVVFSRPLFGAAAGQSCVFYNSLGIVCLGGGVII